MHVSTKNQIENHVSPRIIRFYVQSPDFCYAAPPLSVTSVLCCPWLAVNFMEAHPTISTCIISPTIHMIMKYYAIKLKVIVNLFIRKSKHVAI